MKKLLGYISIISAIVLVGVAISSCIINDSEKEDLPIASMEVSDSGTEFFISFGPITDMKYANIIRESYADDTFKNSSNITRTNIGQVVPSDLDNLGTSFMFSDPYTDTALYYRYYIRYFNGAIYSKSKYTTCHKGIGSGEAELTVTDPQFSYEWDDSLGVYLLTLDTNTTLPTNFKELDVLFNNGSITRPFTFGYPTLSVVSAGDDTLDLQKKLSLEFLDTTITFEGIIGIFYVEEQNEKYTRYYWTLPKDITVTISYTDENGDTLPKDDNDPIYVPSTKNPTNDFDFTKSVRTLSVQ